MNDDTDFTRGETHGSSPQDGLAQTGDSCVNLELPVHFCNLSTPEITKRAEAGLVCVRELGCWGREVGRAFPSLRHARPRPRIRPRPCSPPTACGHRVTVCLFWLLACRRPSVSQAPVA